jgi:hypothetical protein
MTAGKRGLAAHVSQLCATIWNYTAFTLQKVMV